MKHKLDAVFCGAQMVASGAGKADLPAWQIFYMALMAGVYVSMGAMLLLSVGGASTALGQVGSRALGPSLPRTRSQTIRRCSKRPHTGVRTLL